MDPTSDPPLPFEEAELHLVPPTAPPRPVVEVVRSSRRRKTVEARMVGNTMRLMVPASMPDHEVDRWTGDMLRRLERQRRSDNVDLDARARTLARRFGLPLPTSVRWVTNQRHRWGSCTPATGQIRITDRLAAWPAWVLDYVLIHELAHLVHADHSPAFHALVDAYPRAERAKGFLIAKGLDPDDEFAESGAG